MSVCGFPSMSFYLFATSIYCCARIKIVYLRPVKICRPSLGRIRSNPVPVLLCLHTLSTSISHSAVHRLHRPANTNHQIPYKSIHIYIVRYGIIVGWVWDCPTTTHSQIPSAHRWASISISLMERKAVVLSSECVYASCMAIGHPSQIRTLCDKQKGQQEFGTHTQTHTIRRSAISFMPPTVLVYISSSHLSAVS